MSRLYSIYDSGADVYVFFGEFDHDRTAIEFFQQRCSYLPRTGVDMFLCEIGSYNSMTGEVDALERPKRVARGFSIDEGKEKELLPSPSAENDNSTNKDESQVKKHINLHRRWGFYAVLLTLLLAVCAICCVVVTGCNFINVESIENGKVF